MVGGTSGGVGGAFLHPRRFLSALQLKVLLASLANVPKWTVGLDGIHDDSVNEPLHPPSPPSR